MRKAGEWRTLQIGSPWRSVKRERLPLGPTSHILSTASTFPLSLFGSNSLTTTTLANSSTSFIFAKLIRKEKGIRGSNAVYIWKASMKVCRTLRGVALPYIIEESWLKTRLVLRVRKSQPFQDSLTCAVCYKQET